MEKAKDDAKSNIARWADDDRFEVTHMYGGTFVVDMKRRTCTCRRWELTGIPCSHVVCCVGLQQNEPEHLVDPCYSRDAYLKAYKPAIRSINGPTNWIKSKKDPIHASKMLKLPGRPKKTRRREPDEQ